MISFSAAGSATIDRPSAQTVRDGGGLSIIISSPIAAVDQSKRAKGCRPAAQQRTRRRRREMGGWMNKLRRYWKHASSSQHSSIPQRPPHPIPPQETPPLQAPQQASLGAPHHIIPILKKPVSNVRFVSASLSNSRLRRCRLAGRQSIPSSMSNRTEYEARTMCCRGIGNDIPF